MDDHIFFLDKIGNCDNNYKNHNYVDKDLKG